MNIYKIILLATWCKPCIEEFSSIQKIYENVDKTEIEFISISIDDGVDGIPCSILISHEGIILEYGYDLRGPNLSQALQKYLN